jgi:hypothetical protein
MTPKSFTFKLSVPNDPEGATVVAVVAAHAVEYATLEAGAGAAFVERVRAAAQQVLTGGFNTHSQAVFAADNGQLTVTIGGQAVSVPLPA